MSAAFSSTLRSLIPSLNALDDAISNRTCSRCHRFPPLSHTIATSILAVSFVSHSSSATSCPLRRNEHLAVILPRHLWKVSAPVHTSLYLPTDVSCLSSQIHRQATVTSSAVVNPSLSLTADMCVAPFPALVPSSNLDPSSALQKVWWCLLR